MSNNLMNGLKVVEMGTHVALPYFTRVLGDWGAEVIKIEPPRGESYRHIGILFRLPIDEDNNIMFTPYNVNKKSLCLNMKSPESIEIMYKLLEDADVFTTNTRSGALEKMGLSLEELSKRYPKLIIVHLNGFGEKGEERDRPGFDMAAYWCRGGVIGEWTNVEDHPFKPFYGYGDAVISSQLLSGTLAALYNRERTGTGDIVRVSLFSAGLWNNVAGVIRGQPQFDIKFPKSRFTPIGHLDNFYKTKDGKWIIISEENWNMKCEAYFDLIGRPDLKGNSYYCNIVETFSHLEEMVTMFEEAFAQLDSGVIVETLKRIDTVYEFVAMPDALYNDKQAWANDFLREIETPRGDKFVIPNHPVRFESQGLADCHTYPTLGENSVEILAKLGYSEEQIKAMVENKSVIAK